MTKLATLSTIDRHWEDRLGLLPGELDRQGPHVVSHTGRLRGWNGAYLVQRRATQVISVLPDDLPIVHDLMKRKGSSEAFTREDLATTFSNRVTLIVGPAWIGYADSTDVANAEVGNVRALHSRDARALHELAAECGETEWEHSGIEIGEREVCGRFAGDSLVAAGMLKSEGDSIWSVGIVAHPYHRGRGHGEAVVSALARRGLDRGYILQYRTLLSNVPSMSIARAVGFREYATTLSIRLEPPKM